MTRPAGPTLLGVGSLLVVAMLASFTPTPLYPRYQETWDLSGSEVGLAFAAYAVGVLSVLVLLGGVSDRIGRLPTLRLGLALVLTSLLVLALAPSLPALVVGRLLQGFGNGLVTGAGAAAMMEAHPRGLRAGSHLNTLLLACGIAVGPVLAGLVAAALPLPLVTPYAVVALLLVVPAVLLLHARVPGRPDPATRRLVRPVQVPRALLRTFSVGAASIVITNLCLGVVGTFGPAIAREAGWTSSVAAGLFVSGVLASVAVTQVAARGLSPGTGMVLGGVLSCLGWALVTVGLDSGVALAVAAGGATVGAGCGLGLLASAAHIGQVAPVDRRAEIYSAYLVAAFTALGATSLLFGPVVDTWSLTTASALAVALSFLLSCYLTATLRAVPTPTRSTT